MYQKIILTLFFVLCMGVAFAQPIFPTDDALAAPIDGGLSILLAAGAAYGAKKVYEFRNKDNQDEDKDLK